MKYTVFSSGSSGNCSVLKTNELNILIDAGISKKQIEEGLSGVGLSLNDIDYLFITHEHIDHIKSFSALIKLPKLKIVTSKGTLKWITDYARNHNKVKDLENISYKLQTNMIIELERIEDTIMYPDLELNSLKVTFLPLFHDCNEPLGFLFEEDNKKLCYITDTGYVHSDLMPIIYNCEAYVLESNHDPELLMASDRPYYTKLRIIGDHGHISNEDSMYLLSRSIGDKTNLVMHAHVSQECNLNFLIEGKRKEVFKQYNVNAENIDFVILGLAPTKEYLI